MTNAFPRKEIHVHNLESPLGESSVSVLPRGRLIVDEEFKRYAQKRWEEKNNGNVNSVIPSAFEVETTKDSMTIWCYRTEYKYLTGMVELALEKGTSDVQTIVHSLSTEIMPVTQDGMFFLERRPEIGRQHASGFYDLGGNQNAQIWVDKSRAVKPDLVKDIFDVFGFPRWNLFQHFGINGEEINEICYTGYARGFEISIASQFNGYAKVNVTGRDVFARRPENDRLVYRLEDIPEIFASLENNGSRGSRLRSDIYGKIPRPTDEGFKLVDGTIGNLLSNTLHLRGKKEYDIAKVVLATKGYVINEVPMGKIKLDDL